MKKKLLLMSCSFLLACSASTFAQFSSGCLSNSIDISTGVNHPAVSLYPTSPSSASPSLDHYWQVTVIPSNTTGLVAPKCAEMFLTSLGSSSWPNSATCAYIGVVANPVTTNTAQLSPTGNFFWNCPPTTPYTPTTTPTTFTRSFFVQSATNENITVNIPNFWGDDYARIYLDGSTPIYTIATTSTTPGVSVGSIPLTVSPGLHTIDVELWDVSGQGTGIKLDGYISSVNNVLVANTCFGESDPNCVVVVPDPCDANFTAKLHLRTTGAMPDKSIELDVDNFNPTSTYTVDYGDGTGIHPYNPSPFLYTYAGPGTYEICVTETTQSGTTCTTCYQICIGDVRHTQGGNGSDGFSKKALKANAPVQQDFLSIVPNPAHSVAELNIVLAIDNKVTVAIIDMAGKVVAESYNGSLNAGTHKITLETNNLSQGMYQVQVLIGNKVITEKLSVLP